MTAPRFEPAHMPCCEDCRALKQLPAVGEWPPDATCTFDQLPDQHGAATLCGRFTRYAESVELAEGVAGLVAKIHDPERRAAITASFVDCMADVYEWFDGEAWLAGLPRVAVHA